MKPQAIDTAAVQTTLLFAALVAAVEPVTPQDAKTKQRDRTRHHGVVVRDKARRQARRRRDADRFAAFG